MFENVIPTFILYIKEDCPYSEITRALLDFMDLPYTEIIITNSSSGGPKILPSLSIDGNLVSGIGPVCHRISTIVGLHGTTPREDCIVASLAHQILEIWEETIILRPNKRDDEDKICYIMEYMTGFVKGAHNGLYMVGNRLSLADLLMVHFMKYFIKTSLKSDVRLKSRYPRLAHFTLVPRREQTFFDLC